MSRPTLARRGAIKPVVPRIGTLIVKDTFTDTSGLALPSHTGETGATWARTITGYTRDPAVSSAGRSRGSTAGGFAGNDASGVANGDEFDITFDVKVVDLTTTAPKSQCGVDFRRDVSANSYYKAEIFASITGSQVQVRLTKTVTGSFTAITSTTFNCAVGDTLAVSVSCRNAAKSISINGVQQVTTSDNSVVGSTARRVGIAFDNTQTDSTGLHIDNLIVRDALPAAPLPTLPVKVRKVYFAYPGAPMDPTSVAAADVDIIILNAWNVAEMQALKAAIPKIKCLVYKDMAGVKSTFTTYSGVNLYATAMSQAAATANYPGSRLFNSTWAHLTLFTDLNLMDPADPLWQAAAAAAVLGECSLYGWDGVMWDDTNPTLNATPTYPLTSTNNPTGYANDAAYAAGVLSFLKAVYPQFQAARKTMCSNIGKWQVNATTCDPWMKYLDLAVQENYVTFISGSTTAQPGGDIESMNASMANIVGQGGTYIGLQNGTGAAPIRYALANALINARGGQVAIEAAPGNYNVMPSWAPEQAYAIGYPLGAQVESPARVHVREFSTGCVAVNNTTGTVVIPLPAGSTWSSAAAGLSAVTSVSAPAQTGFVFTRDP